MFPAMATCIVIDFWLVILELLKNFSVVNIMELDILIKVKIRIAEIKDRFGVRSKRQDMFFRRN
jgi:hypothetical protein